MRLLATLPLQSTTRHLQLQCRAIGPACTPLVPTFDSVAEVSACCSRAAHNSSIKIVIKCTQQHPTLLPDQLERSGRRRSRLPCGRARPCEASRLATLAELNAGLTWSEQRAARPEAALCWHPHLSSPARAPLALDMLPLSHVWWLAASAWVPSPGEAQRAAAAAASMAGEVRRRGFALVHVLRSPAGLHCGPIPSLVPAASFLLRLWLGLFKQLAGWLAGMRETLLRGSGARLQDAWPHARCLPVPSEPHLVQRYFDRGNADGTRRRGCQLNKSTTGCMVGRTRYVEQHAPMLLCRFHRALP